MLISRWHCGWCWAVGKSRDPALGGGKALSEMWESWSWPRGLGLWGSLTLGHSGAAGSQGRAENGVGSPRAEDKRVLRLEAQRGLQPEN